jgi:predicted enzyme related to lactoylglutathione lyase
MNRITHFEIYTDDPQAVQPFYQDVFAGSSTNSRAARSNIGWLRLAMTNNRESMAG